MAKFINVGDTIEADKAECIARKFVLGIPKKHPITQKIMLLVTTDRNSSVQFAKACIIEYDERMQKMTESFHREVGDVLMADSISIYMDTRKCPSISDKEGVTGRHGANFMTSDVHTIATIKMPIANMRKILGLSNNEPQKLK